MGFEHVNCRTNFISYGVIISYYKMIEMDSLEIQVRDKIVEQRKEIVLNGEQTIAILADAHSNWDYIQRFICLMDMGV